MRVSIVTISFNQVAYIERALLSVLCQDYPDIEYIVVDPGSTDGSRDIIEKYRSRISKVIFEPDQGPADGLNKGFQHSTGEILGYLNSDDAYLPGAIREMLDVFLHAPEVDVVCGNGYVVDNHACVIKRFYSDDISPWRYVHKGSWQMQQSTFFRRSAFMQTGGFNPETRVWWDGELMLDFSMRGMKFKLSDRFWSLWTIHEDSLEGQRNKNSEKANKVRRLELDTWQRFYNKAMGADMDWTTLPMIWAARIIRRVKHPYAGLWRIVEKLGLSSELGKPYCN